MEALWGVEARHQRQVRNAKQRRGGVYLYFLFYFSQSTGSFIDLFVFFFLIRLVLPPLSSSSPPCSKSIPPLPHLLHTHSLSFTPPPIQLETRNETIHVCRGLVDADGWASRWRFRGRDYDGGLGSDWAARGVRLGTG